MGEDMVHESKDSKRDHSSKEILRSGLSGGQKAILELTVSDERMLWANLNLGYPE
jgi:hypothetical protein